ncbi:hypothetical protein CN514_04735 [Bacillus sp. AFS001701]|uniref:hypothetical protein n=1 Tax=Bacillus sp. AFS001701 TaxID=2033480 RepID=UPI000BF370DF|nr:hypothetical protein [Bacillus sp. AFS001701]PET75081.1 hypothetical protein CN514_04735 [Bacillus sp. AFS001701]
MEKRKKLEQALIIKEEKISQIQKMETKLEEEFNNLGIRSEIYSLDVKAGENLIQNHKAFIKKLENDKYLTTHKEMKDFKRLEIAYANSSLNVDKFFIDKLSLARKEQKVTTFDEEQIKKLIEIRKKIKKGQFDSK